MCAQEACAQLGLDHVVWMPVYSPPHKEVPDDPGVDVRVELCRRAVAGDERFSVSRIEADVPGRSYTVDTLRRLHESRPEDELTFIMGGDMAHALPTWHEPEAVLSLATLGVAEREGVGRTDIMERLAGLAGADRIRFFDMPRLDISSSDIRRRVAAGRPIRYLVPDARRRVHRVRRAVRMSAPRAAEQPMEPSKLAELVAGYASDVKAQDIVELDLRGVLGYTDYFVIASGGTDRQAKAVHDRIHENMKKEHGLLPRRVEGLAESRWILMDYLDVIVHIFTPDAREYYRLEQLWGEAPKRDVE